MGSLVALTMVDQVPQNLRHVAQFAHFPSSAIWSSAICLTSALARDLSLQSVIRLPICFARRDLQRYAAANNTRGPGLRPDQLLDRLAGAALGPRLEEATEQDQCHDHRRRLVVDVGRSRRQQTGQEGRGERMAQAAPAPSATSAFMLALP